MSSNHLQRPRWTRSWQRFSRKWASNCVKASGIGLPMPALAVTISPPRRVPRPRSRTFLAYTQQYSVNCFGIPYSPWKLPSLTSWLIDIFVACASKIVSKYLVSARYPVSDHCCCLSNALAQNDTIRHFVVAFVYFCVSGISKPWNNSTWPLQQLSFFKSCS